MLSLKKGRYIAKSGKKIIRINEDGDSGEGYYSFPDLQPLPNKNQRECYYVAGPSGSGKSTYSAMLVRNYLKVIGNKPFISFSRTDLSNDPAFDGLSPMEISIDQNLVENKIDITKEFPQDGCIVLFDDITTIQDKNIKKAVESILSDVLEVGRKLKIYVIFCCHLILGNDRGLNRTVMNEMTSLTVFPKSGSVHQIKYALKNYLGYADSQIMDFLDTDSRWVTFYKTYPQVVLNSNECYLPNS